MAEPVVDRTRIELGARGERAALEWYLSRGYVLIAQNWRCGIGEIDLIVSRSDCVVFCEVKTRMSSRYGSPFEAITSTKARRLRQLAGQWLREHRGYRPRKIRIDIAGVVGSEIEVRHGVI